MAVRLVVSITAAPGKGADSAEAFRARCADVMKEPGCEQFEVFQSVLNPDNWHCSSCGPTKRPSMHTRK